MTLDEVIEEAKGLGEWEITSYSAVRGKGRRDVCPIRAVLEKRFPGEGYYPFADGPVMLGLTKRQINTFVSAADRKSWMAEGEEPTEPLEELRAKMLKAFGLQEVPLDTRQEST